MEWVSGQQPDDEGSRLIITPRTIQSVPEEDDRVVRGEYTRDAKIGFRTAVLLQLGVHSTATAWHILPEPVKLTSYADRPAFA